MVSVLECITHDAVGVLLILIWINVLGSAPFAVFGSETQAIQIKNDIAISI
jgi:hypothetical protein